MIHLYTSPSDKRQENSIIYIIPSWWNKLNDKLNWCRPSYNSSEILQKLYFDGDLTSIEYALHDSRISAFSFTTEIPEDCRDCEKLINYHPLPLLRKKAYIVALPQLILHLNPIRQAPLEWLCTWFRYWVKGNVILYRQLVQARKYATRRAIAPEDSALPATGTESWIWDTYSTKACPSEHKSEWQRHFVIAILSRGRQQIFVDSVKRSEWGMESSSLYSLFQTIQKLLPEQKCSDSL